MAIHFGVIISWCQTRVWRTTVLTQRSLWQFLTLGLRQIFFWFCHTAPKCTPYDHSCGNFTNDKCSTQGIWILDNRTCDRTLKQQQVDLMMFSVIAVFTAILGPISSSAQTWSPGRQMWPTNRSGDPQFRRARSGGQLANLLVIHCL